jgi:two-component system chemotaxis response regulator CheY
MNILVVDDSRAMRMIIQRTLRQAGFGGHTILEAGTAREALSRLREESIDLVLSDWNMPEMSGLELLRAIPSLGIDVRFGFITSEGTPAMRHLAAEAGARFLLSKPFTVESLGAALEGLISG